MAIAFKKNAAVLEGEQFVAAALYPEGRTANPNQLLSFPCGIGRRDSLTELQQKILTAVISPLLFHQSEAQDKLASRMPVIQFLNLFDGEEKKSAAFIVGELEKRSRKGLWLYWAENRRLIRSQWFQTITYENGEVVFQFADRIADLIAAIDPYDIEKRLIKGIQYRGKHTLAVFSAIGAAKKTGVIEYSIDELMRLLFLEATRYSYGQLKLRVLEPSLQEIHDWDDSMYVRFGPTFSGRKVEGVWFRVVTGEEAREVRKSGYFEPSMISKTFRK